MEYMDPEYKAIRRQLLKEDIAKMVANSIDCIDLDFDKITTTKAIVILDEIRNVLMNETNGAKIARKIRKIFDENKIPHEKSAQEKFYESLFEKKG